MTLITSLIPSLKNKPACMENNPSSCEAQTLKPVYEIQEGKEAWGLTVHLPDVDKAGLELTVDQEELRILGRRSWKRPETWTQLYRESSDLAFELVIKHENAIDAEKIHAEIKDGVLRASLPKVSEIKPRKIAVN
jgi:HSP20 family protein